jgi:general secretion pathway protein D
MRRIVLRLPMYLLIAATCCAVSQQMFAQGRPPLKDYIAPDELITMSSETPLATALDIFKSAFRRFENKVLVIEQASNDPITMNITKMYWKDAFEVVLRINSYWYQETPDYVRVFQIPTTKTGTDTLSAESAIETREVEISAIFFEANRSAIEQLGLDWALTNHTAKTNIKTGVINWGSSEFTQQESQSGGSSGSEGNQQQAVDFGEKTILQTYGSSLDIMAVIQAIESENLGELISRPSISVRSEETGRIQVGADISIRQKDFSGNTVEKFYSTGTIISVTPKVMTVDSIEFVHLLPDPTTTIINKTLAETSVILLDQEETVVGGLFSNDLTNIRRGVPFLKDLPWWVLGLRYLFGYEETQEVRKELIIILKARILPSLQNRVAIKMNEIKKGQKSLQQESERIKNLRRGLLQQIEAAKANHAAQP